MASLSASAVPVAERASAPPAARARPRPRRRTTSGAVVWIVVFGLLLAGVVAVNVAVLQSNIRLERLGEDRARLQAENAALASQLSAAAAGPRIQGLAARKLGLVPAQSQDTTYVELAR